MYFSTVIPYDRRSMKYELRQSVKMIECIIKMECDEILTFLTV